MAHPSVANPLDVSVAQPESHSTVERADALRIAFVAVCAALVWFRVWEPFARVSLIGLLGTLVGIYPILREAAENVMARRMTMELSMTIAIVAALAIGQFFTALVILLFVLVAEVLEGLTVNRGRSAIKDLLDLLPRTVTVLHHGEQLEVAAESVGPGDVVLVKPGARIPVDGCVSDGASFVDQSAITGESMPVEKVRGSEVFAGTVNHSGALMIETRGVGRDTAFGRIVQAVEEAERSRAPIQKTADRLAGYVVWFALGCAVLTFILTRNLTSTISVIIVAGACGIAAGTPLAILAGIGQAAQQGAIIKGGRYLEALSSINTVAFDKTGTLTYGNPLVVRIHPVRGHSEEEVLLYAVTAEARSEHPFAEAILKRAVEEGIETPESEDFRYEPGRGISCRAAEGLIVVGNRLMLKERGIELLAPARAGDVPASEILVARGGSYIGSILIADTLRPEALDAVRTLHAMGLKTALITGDSRPIAEATAAEAGIDRVFAEALPHQKRELVRAMVAAGERTAMVGDGVNDAPALMEATVGIAMGAGTEVARQSANVMLIGNDLGKLPAVIYISRHCRAVIMQNFYGTLLVDAAGMVLAAAGVLNPLFAAFLHVSSELTFILNSARLLPSRRMRPARSHSPS
jgi:heavy metal translocating P-type ATPase